MGLLTNSARGVWALTDDGTALLTNPALSETQRRARVRAAWSAHLAELRQVRKARSSRDDDVPDAAGPAQERGWKEQLLDQLMAMRPDGFERLASRLLREADFDSVNVTGKSGDGGIDGDRLCDLLKKYDLGVSTTTRTVEDVTISAAFFSEI
jgi:restriction system protein